MKCIRTNHNKIFLKTITTNSNDGFDYLLDFARTSAVCIVLSCGIMLASGVLGMSGCACRRSTPLLLSGIFLYVSSK